MVRIPATIEYIAGKPGSASREIQLWEETRND